MTRQLLLVVVVCLVFASALSIRCYIGTDKECMLSPDMKDCGSGKACQCAKYRFACTKDDQACSEEEQAAQTRKWAYTVTSKSDCQQMQEASNVYESLKCCSHNGCNRPDSGRCSRAQARRRALRKMTDLLDS